MAPIDSEVIDTKDNSKVLNDVVAIESVIVPVNNKVKKSKAILHKIERASYFSIKRIFDIICSLLGIIALIPVAIVTCSYTENPDCCSHTENPDCFISRA